MTSADSARGPGAWMCPIGIPMGQTVLSGEGQHPTAAPAFFGVRRGGRFCQLDKLDYIVWQTAWSAEPTATGSGSVANRSGRAVEAVQAALKDLVRHRLLLVLSGNPADDWERLRSLRPVPRAIAIGNSADHQQEFRLLPPGRKSDVRLSPQAYVLWSSWDGTADLAGSASDALTGSDLFPALVPHCVVQLVRDAVKGRLAFFDISPGDTSALIAERRSDNA